MSSPPDSWAVRVPASTANLGAGFDVFGMALGLHARAGIGPAPAGAQLVEPTHPAAVAFTALGGDGPLWVASPIPAGRGLGFSGAMRVAGGGAALVQAGGVEALDAAGRERLLEVTVRLERHADNVAASIHGGVVAALHEAAATIVVPIALAVSPAIVVWIPDATTTDTDQSRARLSDAVPRADAVFNLGRVAAFVTACAMGDIELLRAATADRLHQPQRLASAPRSAAALDAALDAGAWAAWLSGSGPTIAAMCDPDDAPRLAAALPPDGHTKVLSIDREGLIVV